MATPRLRIACGFAFLTTVLVSGCGSDPSVSGSVTIDGQNIDGGAITFVSSGSKDGGGGATGQISGGSYRIPASKRLPPGKYTVQISWMKATGKKIKSENDPGVEEEERVQYLPAEYNTASKLSVDLTSGSNTQNFELKGGGSVAPAPGAGGQKKGGAGKGIGDS